MLKQNKHERGGPIYRQLKKSMLTTLFGVASLLGLAVWGCLWITDTQLGSDSAFDTPLEEGSGSNRVLLEKSPDATFSAKQLRSGAVILHIIGVFYMFLAIAIVCDEFFVPAIEVIVDKLKMSPDTAGATFMAAGGSAPELFTSFIGTFITEDDVGFGTIVGSAVFNVLFVIGCCAIASGGDLVLTWWPFARDSSYYCTCLLLLALFFGVFTGEEIYWYESLILLCLYVGYVTLMMKNQKVWKWVQKNFVKKSTSESGDTAAADGDGTARRASERDPDEDMMALRVARPLQFNVSIFELMTRDATLGDLAGLHMVTRMKGDVRDVFREVDQNGDGVVDMDEFRHVLRRLGRHISEAEVAACFSEIDLDSNGSIEFEEFEKWYLRSTWRMKQDVEGIFVKFDKNESGAIDISELKNLLEAVNHERPSDEEAEAARKLLDANGDGQVTLEEFMNWYESSVFFQNELKRRETVAQLDEEEEKGVNIKFPHNWVGRINWFITAPIIFPLYFTIPDVRREKWKGFFPLSFLLSIVWLGIYSYFMVDWASTFGSVCGIPSVVMGLTLLAAGTSVPDLLTSIIVAKMGEGDMAVSSSIGSNIFDILVGLPLPWFLYAVAVGGGKIKVAAGNLFLSIVILFGMILTVLVIIIWQHWRMTKKLGYLMFVLYVVFVIQDLARVYG